MPKQHLDEFYAQHRQAMAAAATPAEKIETLSTFITKAERRIAERQAEIRLWRHHRATLHRNLGGVAIGGMVLPTRVREADALIAQAQGELNRLENTVVSKREKLSRLQAAHDIDAAAHRSIEAIESQRRHFQE